MMKRIDLKMVLATLLCMGTAIGMITGDVQNVIAFADPLNEIGFTVVLMMMALGCAVNIKR